MRGRKTYLKKAGRMILWAIGIYIAFMAFVYLYQRNLMYFPDTSKPALSQAGYEGIEEISVITGDDLDLTGWYKPAENGKPTILWFHGNALHHAYRMSRAIPYMEEGYGVVLAGYRGFGGNPGKPTEQGLYDDARAYMRALIDSGMKEENIILYGESLGSGVAVQLATEFPDVKALVLEAPYTSTVDIGKMRFFYLPVSVLMKDRFESLGKISDVEAPVVVIHGQKDMVIPYRYGKKLYDAAGEPKMLLSYPAAGHNDLADFGAAQDVMNYLE